MFRSISQLWFASVLHRVMYLTSWIKIKYGLMAVTFNIIYIDGDFKHRTRTVGRITGGKWWHTAGLGLMYSTKAATAANVSNQRALLHFTSFSYTLTLCTTRQAERSFYLFIKGDAPITEQSGFYRGNITEGQNLWFVTGPEDMNQQFISAFYTTISFRTNSAL